MQECRKELESSNSDKVFCMAYCIYDVIDTGVSINTEHWPVLDIDVEMNDTGGSAETASYDPYDEL